MKKSRRTANRDGLEARVADNKRQCLASLAGGNQVDGLPPASSALRGLAGLPLVCTDVLVWRVLGCSAVRARLERAWCG